MVFFSPLESDMNKQIAQRLWAMADMLRSGLCDKDTLNTFGEVCDDIAILIATQSGFTYEDVREEAENETFTPTYKFSRGM